MTKKYKDILEEKSDSQALIKIDIDQAALTKVKSVDEALAVADKFVPALQKKVLMSEIGLPEEKREKWLATIDESLHAMSIVPTRRTMTEKTAAVLQQNRFPTASAKFHQAVLESSTFAGILIQETFDYETAKLRLEKKFYKYQKQLKELQRLQEDPNADTFLLEKDLDIKRIALTKEVINLKNLQNQLQNKREELIEWSEIKKELYEEANANGEIWSPDAIDGEAGLQEIPMAMRHLLNYVILKQNPSDGDISSVLNIEGLALTAMREGMRKGKLGFYLKDLTEEQVKVIFLGIYGWHVDIQQIDGFVSYTNIATKEQLVFPTTLENWQKFKQAKS